MKVTAEIYGHNASMNFLCVLCGEDHEQNLSACRLMIDGEAIGDVCPKCLAAGADGTVERIEKWIRGTREYIVALGAVADVLPLVERWPEVSELEQATMSENRAR